MFKAALILAGGAGRRLQAVTRGPKPLVEIGGRPILEWTLLSLVGAEITDCVLLTRHHADQIESFAKTASQGLPFRMTCISSESGKLDHLALAMTQLATHDEFLVLDSDVIFDPSIPTLLKDSVAAHAIIATQRKVRAREGYLSEGHYVKVRTESGGQVTALGKHIENFDSVDTGFQVWKRPALTHLRNHIESTGNTSTQSNFLNDLAQRGQVAFVDVGSRRWIGVDDPAAYQRAIAIHDELRQ